MGAITIKNAAWQGYRHKETGVLVHYDADNKSALPIRATAIKNGKQADVDPNYETGTYGLHSCSASPHRAKFVKQKFGYVFLMTKYQGTNAKLKDKFLVVGYYKIGSVADVRNLHLRHLEDNSCFSEKLCYALKANVMENGENEIVLVSEEDAFVLNAAALKSLAIDKKITKAAKIELDEDKTKKLLKKFEGKENKVAEYIAKTQSALEAANATA
ncbi:MAG: hypothetical protein FWE23_06790 [Chitinivibrionia bacterium]|nr:hypothetical protein [Chitinivibrionia bacterium]